MRSYLVRTTPQGSVDSTKTPAGLWPLAGVFNAETRQEAADRAAGETTVPVSVLLGVYATDTTLVYVEPLPS